MNSKQRQRQYGFIALITVILVAAFIIVVGTSIALMNADELLSAYSWLQTSKSSSSMYSCTDNILARLRNNTSITGNVNISVGDTACTSIISASGNIRILTVSSTATDPFGRNIVSRQNINVNINANPFTIQSYKDILK